MGCVPATRRTATGAITCAEGNGMGSPRADGRGGPIGRFAPDRGATGVETALILPVLCAFVFGMIEYGMVIKDSIAVTAATRTGARTASADAKYNGFDDATAASMTSAVSVLDAGSIKELWVYKAAADGRPVGDSGTFASCSSCSKYVWNQATKTFVKTSSSWTATQQNACMGTADSVGVWLHVEHAAFTHLFFNSVTLTDKAVMQLEPRPAGQCAGS
jgi:Flp pilus assembly protein TadG